MHTCRCVQLVHGGENVVSGCQQAVVAAPLIGQYSELAHKDLRTELISSC